MGGKKVFSAELDEYDYRILSGILRSELHANRDFILTGKSAGIEELIKSRIKVMEKVLVQNGISIEFEAES